MRFGLRDKSKHHALRLLDEKLAGELGLPYAELSLPLRSIATLDVSNARVIIVENDLTLLTLPSMERTLALRGSGAAVTRLEKLTWLRRNRAVYWGDIDVEGFLILSRLRNRFPHVVSILMDATTLRRHAAVAIEGNGSHVEPPTNLMPAELEAFLECRRLNRRLEQESIPQPYVDAAFAPLQAFSNLFPT